MEQTSLFDPPEIPECMQLTPEDNRNAAYIASKPTHESQALRVLQAVKALQPANYHQIHKWLESDGSIFPVTSLTRAIKDNSDNGYIHVKDGDHKLYDPEPQKHWQGKRIHTLSHYSLTQDGKERLKNGT